MKKFNMTKKDWMEIGIKSGWLKSTFAQIDIIDRNKIGKQILNNKDLYNWAIGEGVPSDEIGDENSADYNRFIENNATEIIQSINKSLSE